MADRGAAHMAEFWDARARENANYFVDNRLDYNAGDEAAFWRDHLDASAAAAAVAGRVVLLVVDASSSLWPVTVGAAVLRRAGASAVLPLLLHRRP